MFRTRLVTSFAVIALVAGACSSGEPQGATPSGSRSPNASVSPTDAPSGSTSPGPRARKEDRVPTGKAAPAAPPAGKAPVHTPPAPGLYRYKQSGSAKFGAISSEPDPQGTLSIETAHIEGDGQAQRQVRKISDRSEITSVYLFKKDAVLLTYISQQGVECAPDPALTAIALPLKIDSKWSSNGKCGDINAKLQGQVMAEETLTIAGKAVKTFRINLATEISAEGFFQTTGMKVWISPDYRLIVRSEEASRGSFNGAALESDLTSELMNLKPA